MELPSTPQRSGWSVELRKHARKLLIGSLAALWCSGGCIGAVPDARSDKSTEERPASTSVVDLRQQFEKYGLVVRQQGKRGSCQVFAFVGVIEYALAKRGTPSDLSEQFLMWAANEANGLDRVEGFNPDYLISGLNKHGICCENLMPYVPTNDPLGTPGEAARREARSLATCKLISIKHWSSPIGFTEDHINRLRTELDRGQPVTVTLCWPYNVPDARIVDNNYYMIDADIDGASKNGHGVILVGYGLDASVPGGGYFWFRNSWGREFANQGYARITFEFARKYGTDAYFVVL